MAAGAGRDDHRRIRHDSGRFSRRLPVGRRGRILAFTGFYPICLFRFHNRGEGVKGLYFVGAGTHPGAGLPGVISSAKVLDQLLPKVELDA